MKRERLDILAKKFASESISSGELGELDLVDLLEYGFKKGVEWADNNPRIGRRGQDIKENPKEVENIVG